MISIDFMVKKDKFMMNIACIKCFFQANLLPGVQWKSFFGDFFVRVQYLIILSKCQFWKKLALLLNLFYISGARSHVHQSIFGLDGLHNGCNIYSGLDFGSCYKSLRFSFDLILLIFKKMDEEIQIYALTKGYLIPFCFPMCVLLLLVCEN